MVSVDTSIALPPAGHLEALYEPVLSLCKATLPGWQNLQSGDVEVCVLFWGRGDCACV
jgi:hypothetical protein